MPLETFLALLRHAMTAGGTYLTGAGLATTEAVDIAAGAVITVIGFGWSIYRKWERQRDA